MTTISSLPAAKTLSGFELVPADQGNTTVKLSISQIATVTPQSAAEAAAGVVPTNVGYLVGNVLRYGADPSGTTDSTAAFVAAAALGALIYAPAGSYRLTSGITLTGGGIVGDGAYQTTIFSTDTSSVPVLNYIGALAGKFENFQLKCPVGKTTGAAIQVGPTSGEVSAMRFFQIVINQSPTGISFVRASLWSVIACNFYGFINNGILVDNQNNGDSGDSTILGCVFTSVGNTNSFAIQYVSSGGLRVIDNKINNVGVGILLNLGTVVGNVSTSDLLVTGNSIEGAFFSCIQLQRQAGSTSTFQNVFITGNQLLVLQPNASCIYSVDTSGFLSAVTITGNILTMQASGNDAVQIDYITDFTIGDNTILGSNSANQSGLVIGTHGTGKTSVNSYAHVTTSINATTASTQILKHDSQSGTGTISMTGSNSYGGLFISTTNTVTYPTAFNSNVGVTFGDITWAITSGANPPAGVSLLVSALNDTNGALGFVVSAISAASSGTVSFAWEAKGVI